jgi:hypothetical protein
VHHPRHGLNFGSGEHDVCPADCHVRARRVGRKLVTDEGIKPALCQPLLLSRVWAAAMDWMRPFSDRRNSSMEWLPWRVDTATLTLNVLLSFVQSSGRSPQSASKDKIAASKRKGLWVGGMTPLGYDARDRKIVVNEVEADRVRTIFQRYLTLAPAVGQCAELLAGIRRADEGAYARARPRLKLDVRRKPIGSDRRAAVRPRPIFGCSRDGPTHLEISKDRPSIFPPDRSLAAASDTRICLPRGMPRRRASGAATGLL